MVDLPPRVARSRLLRSLTGRAGAGVRADGSPLFGVELVGLVGFEPAAERVREPVCAPGFFAAGFFWFFASALGSLFELFFFAMGRLYRPSRFRNLTAGGKNCAACAASQGCNV